MRLLLITGFLGAGKSTFVSEVLKSVGRQRVALLVNEFGRIGVDGEILKGKAVDIVELTSGCICCELKDTMLAALDEISERINPDLVVVESSGVAEPTSLIPDLLACGMELLPVFTIVDASRLASMLYKLGPFYRQQIEAADVVILNKRDLVTEGGLLEAERKVFELNPNVELLVTENCKLTGNNTLKDCLSRRAASKRAIPHSHAHNSAFSAIAELSGTVTLEELEAAFANLESSLWRAKGHVIISGKSQLVQYSSGQLEIEESRPQDSHKIVLIGPNQKLVDEIAKLLSLLGC